MSNNEAEIQTRAPNLGQYFDYLLQWWHYEDTWGDSFTSELLLAKLPSFLGSAVCIVANTLLIFAILSHKHRRSFKFFPIIFQAGVDILGPGCCNFAYEWAAYKKMMQYYEMKVEKRLSDRMDLADLDEGNRLENNYGCFLTFLRAVLNEYSTGICILMSALINYCSVCHATRTILTSKVLKTVAFFMVFATFAAILANFLDVALRFHPTLDFHYDWAEDGYFLDNRYKNNRLEYLEISCQYFYFRRGMRLLIDSIVCLLIPGLVSGVFYTLVGYGLWKNRRENQETGNRNDVTIAFAISWFVWLVCWGPYYYVMSLRNGYEVYEFEDSFRYVMHKYLILTKYALVSAYSFLNPLVFFIISKSLRKDLYDSVKSSIFITDADTSAAKTESEKSSEEEPNETSVEESANERLRLFRKRTFKMFVTTSFLLIALLFFQTLQLPSVEKVAQGSDWLRELVPVHVSAGKTRFLRLAEFHTGMYDNRISCANNRGRIDYYFKRCYFMEHHSGTGLNLTEQVQHCQSRDAFLTYPRTGIEIDFLWYLYRTWMNFRRSETLQPEDDWFFHVGLIFDHRKQKSRHRDVYFTSVDLALVSISGYDHYWLTEFYDWNQETEDYVFDGPAVCLTFVLYPINCLPRTQRRQSICSVDLTLFPQMTFF